MRSDFFKAISRSSSVMAFSNRIFISSSNFFKPSSSLLIVATFSLAASAFIMISNSPSSSSALRAANVAISCCNCSSSFGEALPPESLASSFAMRSETDSTSTSLRRKSIVTSASSASAVTNNSALAASRVCIAVSCSRSGKDFNLCKACIIAESILCNSMRLFWSETEAFIATPSPSRLIEHDVIVNSCELPPILKAQC
ncbi:unannotated protein [freshwater metagenome]|uniref:Unannotated protein n=1 Tax=freshwater metagenome TaxID=449393 RepID=A0A6J6T4M0_9ZZZZ